MGTILPFPGVELAEQTEESPKERLTITFCTKDDEKTMMILNREQATMLKELIDMWLTTSKVDGEAI